MSDFSGIGSVFMGIGMMAFMFVMSWFMAQFVRYYKNLADTEERYEIFEQMSLSAMARKKGYDIEKEMIQRSSSFRKRAQEQLIKETFQDKSKNA